MKNNDIFPFRSKLKSVKCISNKTLKHKKTRVFACARQNAFSREVCKCTKLCSIELRLVSHYRKANQIRKSFHFAYSLTKHIQ